MNRIFHLVLALALSGAGVGLVSSDATASDVHVGVSLAIPFPNGAIGISVGNAPYHHGYGPYYGARPYGHHGYHHGPPPYGACVPWLPSSYVGVVINGATYFHNGAVYYQYTPGGYQLCPAPVAVAAPAPVVYAPAPVVSTPAPAATPAPAPAPVVVLPSGTDMSGYLPLRLGRTKYFYKSGMFFQKTSKGYVSTEVPVGAIAARLPGDSVSILCDGREYFESDNVLFKPARDGFMVIGGA